MTGYRKKQEIGATILHFDGKRIAPIAFEDVEHVKVTRAFLADPDRYLAIRFDDEEDA